MADNRFELDIYLHELPSEESRDKEKLKETTEAENEENDGKKIKTAADAKKSAKHFSYNLAQAVSYVKEVGSQEINFRVSRHATMYGNEARSNKLSNEMQMFKSVASMGTTIAAGFKMGGVWGGVIAIAGTALTTAQDVSQRLQLYEDKQEDHVLNAAFAQERLGMITSSKGR